MTTGPLGHRIIKTWEASDRLDVCLEDSGNIVLRRRYPGGRGQGFITITNVKALCDALYAAQLEQTFGVVIDPSGRKD